MQPKIYYLELCNYPILDQLKLEEALLRTSSANWCLVNRGTSPSVVLGISGKPERDLDLPFLEGKGISVIRRFSGGGTVVVDEGTVFVTLICNKKDLNVEPFPCSILRWTKEVYQPLFAGIDFSLQEQDYVVDRRKCGGNAQCILKERWLHHTSFLWDYDPERMRCLRIPARVPAYRQGRGHEEFVCRLGSFIANQEGFIEDLSTSLTRWFSPCLPSLSEATSHLAIPHRKATACLDFATEVYRPLHPISDGVCAV